MSKNRDLWDQGVRIIQYPNGHRTELRLSSTGLVHEFPIETPEEARIREICTLQSRIESDTARLAELQGDWYDDY